METLEFEVSVWLAPRMINHLQLGALWVLDGDMAKKETKQYEQDLF